MYYIYRNLQTIFLPDIARRNDMFSADGSSGTQSMMLKLVNASITAASPATALLPTGIKFPIAPYVMFMPHNMEIVL